MTAVPDDGYDGQEAGDDEGSPDEQETATTAIRRPREATSPRTIVCEDIGSPLPIGQRARRAVHTHADA